MKLSDGLKRTCSAKHLSHSNVGTAKGDILRDLPSFFALRAVEVQELTIRPVAQQELRDQDVP